MKKNLLILFVISFFCLIFSTYLFFQIERPIEVYSLYSSVSVNQEASLGFDLNDSALTFGNLSYSGSSLRRITLTNPHKYPLIVKVSSTGSISKLLLYDSSNYLAPKGNITIPITAYAGEEEGFYEGFVKFKLYRSNS